MVAEREILKSDREAMTARKLIFERDLYGKSIVVFGRVGDHFFALKFAYVD
jgi:hypothetical protein